MLDKHVCPKCGQLYALALDKCPLCGANAPEPEYTPVHRERITEAERRRRNEEQRRSMRSAGMTEREKKRAKAAATEKYLQQMEEQARRERIQARMQRNGTTAEEERARIPTGYLVLSVVTLLAALLIGVTFLLWRSGVVESSFYDKLSGRTQEASVETQAQTEPVKPSVELKLDITALEFTGVGQTQQLTATLTPADETAVISYQSSAPEVATVDATGLITALATGEADITVSCAGAQAVCHVDCSALAEVYDPQVDLELNHESLSFYAKGETAVLEVTNVDNPAAVAIWSIDDESIATIDKDGKVTAVSEGTASVTVIIGESVGSCPIKCSFDE